MARREIGEGAAWTGAAVGTALAAAGLFLVISGLRGGSNLAMVAGLPFLLTGLFLIGAYLKTQRTRAAISRRGIALKAVVREVVLERVEHASVLDSTFWRVEALGAWPDGEEQLFRSGRIKQDPRPGIDAGTLVTVLADPLTRSYEMDLDAASSESSVQGSIIPAERSDRSAAWREEAGLSTGALRAAAGAVLALGAMLVITGLVWSAQGALAFGIVFLLVGGALAWLSRAASGQDRGFGEKGIRFPARVIKVTHERVATGGSQVRERWYVAAAGSWPDGCAQSFESFALLDDPHLAEGEFVEITGDPNTRQYRMSAAPVAPNAAGLKLSN